MTSIVEMVRHYQRSIEKSLENPSRLIHCVEKLNKLPITVDHLQETGVGRTVNNLRKYDGEVGYASKALVSKWKTMVATEEAENDSHDEDVDTEPMQEESHEDNDEEPDTDEDEGESQLQIDETENIDPVVESSDDYQDRHVINTDTVKSHENHHKKSSKHSSDKKHKHKSEKKHSHKDRDRNSSASAHHKESSSRKERDSSSSKDKRHKEESHKTEEKESKKNETKSQSKHHSSSSSKDSSHKSDSHSSKKSSKSNLPDGSPDGNSTHDERRKKHESKKESRSQESVKKSSKKDKDRDDKDGKKRKRDTSEIVIDSTMGASFADALGMLDMPSSSASSSSKSKKHLSERPSTSAAPSTSSNVASTSTKKPSYSTNSSSNNFTSTTPTKKLMAEPELLMKRPKLEPLPDIVADIPAPTFTISNNYKPMPLNQTVMDCVFNQSSKPMRQMTEEEQLTISISSNKSRTKVFSGAKTGVKGKVESLFELCIRLLQEHIDYLEYTGGVPFDILRPVLERATHDQLMTLEDYNPYLIEDSDCLWEQHCKRRFRGKRPQEMESWREMFLRCLDEEQAKFKNLTENIKLARDKKLPVRKTKLAYVDSAVKPPRSIKSKQMKYGTDSLPNVTPASRVESLKNVGGNSASIGDRRLKIAAELRNSIPTHGPRINPNKKAPLMAKTLISMKKVFKR